MAEDEDFTKLSNVVPEFWHDLIARIIPGLLIIITTSTDPIQYSKDISAGGFIGVILCAYAIGISADLLFGCICSFIPPISNMSEHLYKQLKHPSGERSLLVKMLAEIVLLRTLFFWSLTNAILYFLNDWKPDLINNYLSFLNIHPIMISGSTATITLVGWIRIMLETNKRFPDPNKEQLKIENSTSTG
jgi:hypothetical protein